MNVRPSPIQQKQKIATYFTRAITIIIVILTFSVLFQNYQISSQLIAQEVQRTANQTSGLVQGMVNFRLSLLKIHQDGSAKNADLLHAVSSGKSQYIDQYFRSVDQLDPDNTPDVRFIAGLNDMLWDDGNAQFYGIVSNELESVSHRIAVNSEWMLVKIPSLLETVYALARRTPLVSNSGELNGYLYVMFVINNNYNLIEQIRSRSNSQNLILAIGSNVLSTTLNGEESYSEQDVLTHPQHSDRLESYTVNTTELNVDGNPTQLIMYAVQDNQNVVKLKRNFYYGVVFILVATALFSFILWRWLHKRIRAEIEKLVQFSRSIVDRGTEHVFHGSKIEEFDLFGRALEHTFKRLSEQEKQFENLFNFSIAPTILWGADGRLLRMNPAAVKQFSKENQVATFYELKERLIPSIKKASSGETLNEVATEFEDQTFRWTISPIVTEGRVESVLTQGQDVTTIAEAEKQSHLARSEAERAAGARADFLARMSHEVRTPLNGILGVSQLLKESVTDDKQREQVGVLCLCSEHLLAVLNDILDFSKIEQNKFKLNPVHFHLIETVRVIERIYQPLCQEKELELDVMTNIQEDTVVVVDQIRLNQIIFNLLNNAIKFTREGEICVLLNLNHSEGGAMFHVSISDTGIGIGHDDLSLIFEPFIQGGTTSNREFGGSGLGLSIVKNLVELMGGDVSVSSQVGKGSCFEFTIPIEVELYHAKKEKEAIELDPSGQLFEQSPHVLLVEDNKTNAYIAKAFCDRFGLRVTWVEDGTTAVETVKKMGFDLILMDNQLPGMDGVEVTDFVKHQLKLDTPIYACTADDTEKTKNDFLHAGAEYILVKPIREENLYKALVHFRDSHWVPLTSSVLQSH
ncbi:LuxQ periplasmic sensor domain-containing protein [Vibrio gazogenes]|uniref:Autoinducer 2 sensor kinase/phosphatase LuxQ n=1 Tax=Vibrio gazogenes DSM 21264 = NBRC 103151 TaxID=1123492 RepID=A0A1M4VME3_VIBGA|nr:LuxQ periplasmic sensor domain-containing protein [Vibrio gazogenes]USP15508.1 ATP-binding protein [Vibrio gazogenes]SHE70169.1 two-component system, autoinducer 2 sensor kinase/phosphatase LuxQ [Vibrio gazogenes DSM 21264] [Vibrio gazogenes DSM 21264 = NBRC 103151]SJN57413.1 Autoinducer 2 sensor kinase/phosphatase LuxQ [Vibrio gazogenes]